MRGAGPWLKEDLPLAAVLLLCLYALPLLAAGLGVLVAVDRHRQGRRFMRNLAIGVVILAAALILAVPLLRSDAPRPL